jgi:hypothetical protein
LWFLHGLSDLGILAWMAGRLTKKASHAGIIVNNHRGGRGGKRTERRMQSFKVAEVITWLANTGTKQVTVFDTEGMMKDD